jgi:hypothetical protein
MLVACAGSERRPPRPSPQRRRATRSAGQLSPRAHPSLPHGAPSAASRRAAPRRAAALACRLDRPTDRPPTSAAPDSRRGPPPPRTCARQTDPTDRIGPPPHFLDPRVTALQSFCPHVRTRAPALLPRTACVLRRAARASAAALLLVRPCRGSTSSVVTKVTRVYLRRISREQIVSERSPLGCAHCLRTNTPCERRGCAGGIELSH